MPPVVVSDDGSVKWGLKQRDLEQLCGAYESESFPLAIGSCRFRVQKDGCNYKFKLKIPQNSTSHTIFFSIETAHEVRKCKLFRGSEDPVLLFAGCILNEYDTIDISARCSSECHSIWSRNEACDVDYDHIKTPKNKDIERSYKGNVVDDEKVLTTMDKGAEESPKKDDVVDDKKVETPKDKGAKESLKKYSVVDDKKVVTPKNKGAEVSPNEDNVVDDKKVVTPKNRVIIKIVTNYEEYLRSGKYSDAVLNVQGKEFKVHRVILGKQSPVFSAMFDEVEKKNIKVVNIEDCDSETFPDFLYCIYKGEVEDLTSENAPHLYVAANKFQLHELKKECLKHIKGNVSVENFCDVMSFSLLHQEEELTRIATRFFKENVDDILETSKWATFYNENQKAGNKLILQLRK